jgi:hypothetical protein
MARYVMRLSMALGDLRIAGHYATRNRQNAAERLYFVRLVASHLREIVLIMEPPDQTVIPTVERFLSSLPRGTKPPRAEIRAAHRKALAMLDRPMSPERPDITITKRKRGTQVVVERPPTLRGDLKEIRDRTFHYGHDQGGDAALRAAMTTVAGEALMTGYTIRDGRMRADYADDVSANLAHPFPFDLAGEMHDRIVKFIGPVASFIQLIEAAWMYVHGDDVIVRRPGAPPETYKALEQRTRR